MQAIDMRSRPPYGAFAEDFVFDLEAREKAAARNGQKVPESVRERSMAQFLAEKERAGIGKCVVPVRGSRAQKDNPILEQLLAEYPDDFLGMASLTMPGEDKEGDLATIAQYVQNGLCAGINLEPGLDIKPWNIDDEKIYHVYEVCEQNAIPVMILNGGLLHRADAGDYGLYLPMRIEHIAKDFPKLTIICAHGGWPWIVPMCAAAMNWSNVYISPDCYFMDGIGGRDYLDAINHAVLQDQVLFGTVYPGYSMDFAVDFYTHAGIKPEVLPKILYENAAKIFKL